MAASQSRARTGLGTKIVFTQSQFTGEIIETIDGLGGTRERYDTTHMGTAPLEQGDFSNSESIPADVADIADMTFVLHLDTANPIPPISEEDQTIEIIFRRRKTELTAAKFIGCGGIKSYAWTVPVRGKMTMRCTVGFTGTPRYIKPTLVAA